MKWLQRQTSLGPHTEAHSLCAYAIASRAELYAFSRCYSFINVTKIRPRPIFYQMPDFSFKKLKYCTSSSISAWTPPQTLIGAVFGEGRMEGGKGSGN